MALNYQGGGMIYDDPATADVNDSSIATASQEQSQASAQDALQRQREEAERAMRSLQSSMTPPGYEGYGRYESSPQYTQNAYYSTGPQNDYQRIQSHNAQVFSQARASGKSKSKLVAGLLHIFGGSLGLGNFYTGHYGKAIAQVVLTLCTGGFGSLVTSIWGLVDGIKTLTANPNSKFAYDSEGNLLV